MLVYECELQILIVDDDDVDCECVCCCLCCSSLYIIMVEAGSGYEAMVILRSYSIDCVLLDNCLGDIIGLVLLQQICQFILYDGFIIMVIGVGSESLVVEVMQEGVIDYLFKVQFDVECLMQVIVCSLQCQ